MQRSLHANSNCISRQPLQWCSGEQSLVLHGDTCTMDKVEGGSRSAAHARAVVEKVNGGASRLSCCLLLATEGGHRRWQRGGCRAIGWHWGQGDGVVLR